jgi:hypothetical protein
MECEVPSPTDNLLARGRSAVNRCAWMSLIPPLTVEVAAVPRFSALCQKQNTQITDGQ